MWGRGGGGWEGGSTSVCPQIRLPFSSINGFFKNPHSSSHINRLSIWIKVRPNMCVYVCVCVCVCVCVYVYVYVCMHVCMYVCVCVCVYMVCMCKSVCVCVYMYVCESVHACVYTSVYT